MSRFYHFAYFIGFTPWEHGLAQESVANQIASMFDREDARGVGRALDIGCGSGIHSVALAKRGWDVTGVDIVPKALAAARQRASDAGVDIRFIEADVTRLRDAGVGENFRLILDFGTVHGLAPAQRRAVGREVTAIAAVDAAILMLAFAPGTRGPLPRGMSRPDVEATYPGWTVTDEIAQDAHLPFFLKATGANPRWYRLERK